MAVAFEVFHHCDGKPPTASPDDLIAVLAARQHGVVENDRERDRRLAVAGYRVVRATWRQFHETPAGLAADLRALLATAGTGACASTPPLTDRAR